MQRNKSGWTLVEIITVVAIIGLLTVITIPNFVKDRNEQGAESAKNVLSTVSGAQGKQGLERPAIVALRLEPAPNQPINKFGLHFEVFPSPDDGGDACVQLIRFMIEHTNLILVEAHPAASPIHYRGYNEENEPRMTVVRLKSNRSFSPTNGYVALFMPKEAPAEKSPANAPIKK